MIVTGVGSLLIATPPAMPVAFRLKLAAVSLAGVETLKVVPLGSAAFSAMTTFGSSAVSPRSAGESKTLPAGNGMSCTRSAAAPAVMFSPMFPP